MPIAVSCPTCGARLKAPETSVGKTVKCPKCAAGVVIQTAAPPPPVVSARPRPAPEPDEDDEPLRLSSKRSGTSRPSEPDEDEDDEPLRPSQRRSSRRRDNDEYEDDYDDHPLRRSDERSTYRSSPTSRTVYIVLGLFLGGLGVHNFVAGRTGIAISQLAIFLLSLPLMCVGVGFVTIFIPPIWALVDVVAVQHDGQGRRMV